MTERMWFDQRTLSRRASRAAGKISRGAGSGAHRKTLSLLRGTEGSNRPPSRGESVANLTSAGQASRRLAGHNERRSGAEVRPWSTVTRILTSTEGIRVSCPPSPLAPCTWALNCRTSAITSRAKAAHRAPLEAKLRVSAPPRSQLIGSTLAAARGARFTIAQDGRRGDPWPHNHAESGECRLYTQPHRCGLMPRRLFGFIECRPAPP